MNELEFQEEWLSAYLDDELTDEQRQVVEQRLAIDPAAQATLEDLQRVRSMVSKLPSWSGPDLKFAIPAGMPGNFDEEDELDDDPENESDDLEDFEEVPRVIAGSDERRVSFDVKPQREFSPHSLRSLLVWGATAASILLVAGVGSLFFWPPTGSQVAYESAAPASAPRFAPRLAESENSNAEIDNFPSMEKAGPEDTGLVPDGVDPMGRAKTFGAPVAGGDQSGTGFADPSSLAKESIQPPAEAVAPQADIPPPSNVADMKMKSELAPAASGSTPGAPGAAFSRAGGLGGAVADANLAMNNPVADSPAAGSPAPRSLTPRSLATELPPPASIRSSGVESVETTNAPNSLPASAFYYARSQSWSDDETLSRLSSAVQQNRADQLAFGNSAYQRGAEQNSGEVATESVLMAAIKPEAANSPEFFQNILKSNRLVALDQPPVLNQFSTANAAQMAKAAQANNSAQAANTVPSNLPNNNSLANNAAATERMEAGQSNALSTESTNALGLNRYSNQRYQMAMPNQAQGNSIVLFLTRDEANQILNQLRETGQVTSQIWTVDKQPDAQVAADKQSYNTITPPTSQNTANQLGVNEPAKQASQANQRIEPTTNDKVILLLNGPPN